MSRNSRHTAEFVQNVLRFALFFCFIVNCQLSIVNCYAAIGSAITKIDSANFNAHVIRALEALKGDTKLKPDPKYKITFRKGDAKGFDAYRWAPLRKYYHIDPTGTPVPWLAVAAGSPFTVQGRYEAGDEEAAKQTPLNIEAAIIKDMGNTTGLLPSLSRNPDLVDAWKMVANHSQIRKDIPSLEKISELLGDDVFMKKLPKGNEDLIDLINAIKNPIKGGTNAKLVPLVEHLENVRMVFKNQSGADGLPQLISDLKNPAFAMQDGTTHMLNHVKTFPEGSVKKFEYEFEGNGILCIKCRFDVELSNPTKENPLRLIEYKSWSLENIPNISTDQLVEYIRNCSSIDEMMYVFNKMKTPDIASIKKKMQVVFEKNANKIFNAMTDDFKRSLGSGTNIIGKSDFIKMISNNDSKLYNFINFY